MAARKSLYLSLQSQLVECVILLGKDLTTQSAHPVWALVVATDTSVAEYWFLNDGRFVLERGAIAYGETWLPCNMLVTALPFE